MRTLTIQGVSIPKLGLGTSELQGDVARRMVRYALDIGYRHIDTAQSYRNEADIGAAIHTSSVSRDDIWLTTKVAPNRFRGGDLQRSAQDSVRQLQTVPDLLLLHWPNAEVPLRETIAALNDTRRQGLARHIGVSNFTVALLREALAFTDEPLLVNQVEYHPFLSQRAVLDVLRANGVALTAFSPLALGRVFRDDTLRQVGKRYGKGPGQVALRWLLQQEGVVAIPRTSSQANARANLRIFDFELADADMARIFALANRRGRLVDPLHLAPVWDDLDAIGRTGRYARRIVHTVRRRARRIYRALTD
jgi:diketogulonate reductase-like aldo/keto reductase